MAYITLKTSLYDLPFFVLPLRQKPLILSSFSCLGFYFWVRDRDKKKEEREKGEDREGERGRGRGERKEKQTTAGGGMDFL